MWGEKGVFTRKPPVKYLLGRLWQEDNFAAKSCMLKDEQVQEKIFASISGWQRSDCTQREWCRQQGIPYHIFHYWYRKLKDRQVPAEGSGSFVQLAVTSTPATGCEVVFTDGTRIVFHQPVTVQYLKSLLF